MSPQNGELRPTGGWDRSSSLGHPCEFQQVSRLGSVTARHSSSGHQPNSASLNRGRHLYSTGRPSVGHWPKCLVQFCFHFSLSPCIILFLLFSPFLLLIYLDVVSLLYFSLGIAEAKCILITSVCLTVCVCVCLSVCPSVCPSTHSHTTAWTRSNLG